MKPAAPSEPKFVPPATGELITLKPPIIVRDLAEQLKEAISTDCGPDLLNVLQR
jgi:hypothetical protein